MAKTLAQLNAEISKLQAEAEALRDRERGDVIRRIKEAIGVYGLTTADLGLDAARRGRRGRKAAEEQPKGRRGKGAAPKKKPGVVKYRDDQGNTWSGHGRRPQWFLDALASGKSQADLLA